MRSLLNRARSSRTQPEGAVQATDPAPLPGGAAAPDSAAVGMRDAMMAGWFDNDSGELFRGMPIGSEDVVVDVGCGDGGNLGFCAQRGAHLIAVDIDGKVLESARERLSGSPARQVDVLQGTAEQIPVIDGTATRVICTEVLEHVDDPAVALADLVRIGAPGALYLITVPDALQEHMQEHVAPDFYFQKPNHIRIIERDEFAGLITDAGLEIIEHATYGFFWSVWFALFWSTEVDLTDTRHPVLDHWTQAWAALLDTEKGRLLKRQLDDFMPKSQVIVARKPC